MTKREISPENHQNFQELIISFTETFSVYKHVFKVGINTDKSLLAIAIVYSFPLSILALIAYLVQMAMPQNLPHSLCSFLFAIAETSL